MTLTVPVHNQGAETFKSQLKNQTTGKLVNIIGSQPVENNWKLLKTTIIFNRWH